MSTRDKKLSKWLSDAPKLESIDSVRGVVEWAIRNLGFEDRTRDGSHIKLFHRKLLGHDDFHGGLGTFDIPIKGGQQVKGQYLELLAQAIDVVRGVQ